MFSFHRSLRVMCVFLAAGLIPACNGSLGQNGNSSAPPSFGGASLTIPASTNKGEIDLSWTPATDFSGTGISTYNIWYAQGTVSGSETFQFAVLASVDPTGVAVTGLTSGTTYIFHVQAQDGTGALDSNTAEVTATAP